MKTINSIAGKYNVDIEKAKELLAKKGVDVSDIDAELDLENEMLVEEILSVQQRFVQLEAGLKPGKMIETRVYPTYETKKDGLKGCSTFFGFVTAGIFLTIIIFFASMYGKAKDQEIPKSESKSMSVIEDESQSSGNMSQLDDSLPSSDSQLDENASKYTVFSWFDEIGGKQWEYSIELSNKLFNELSESEALGIKQVAADNRAYDVFAKIAADFAANEGDSEQEDAHISTARMLISFVQSLDFAASTEKVRANYAFETLYAQCGDDEDLSVLMAVLLKAYGSDVVIFRFEGRTAVGIALETEEIEGLFYEYGGKKYYYIDSVAGSYDIGMAPDGISAQTPEIIEFELTAPE